MRVLFDGLVFTSYAQMTLTTGMVEPPIPDAAFIGQVNGRCGARVTGALFLITVTHTWVPVRVSLWDDAPGLGRSEEVVEASLVPAGGAAFAGWADDPVARFDLPAPSYRARWNARGMDAGHAQSAADVGHPAPDSYELMLWPAPHSADAILRRTAAQAAYWHDEGFTRR